MHIRSIVLIGMALASAVSGFSETEIAGSVGQSQAFGGFTGRFGASLLSKDSGEWDRIARLGCAWLRLSSHGTARWDQIEPIPGSYRWTQEWTVLNGQRLLPTHRTIAIIGGAPLPAWAATQPCGPIDQASLEAFAQFAAAVVERYDGDGVNDATGSPRIAYWELLNEPDTTTQGDTFVPDCWGDYPEQYAQLLRACYPAIKRADSSAQVLIGGLAVCSSDESKCQFASVFNPAFLEQFLAVPGVGAWFDLMNIHYYEIEHKAWDPLGPGIIGKYQYVRNCMTRHGIDKPILVSETGICEGQTAYGIQVTDDNQGEFLFKLAARVMATDLCAAIWWPVEDVPGYADCGFYWHGADRQALPAKPIAHAMEILGRELDQFDRAIPEYSGSGLPLIEQYAFVEDASSKGDLVDDSHQSPQPPELVQDAAPVVHPEAPIDQPGEGAPGPLSVRMVWANVTQPATAVFSCAGATLITATGQQSSIQEGSPQDLDQTTNGQLVLRIGTSPVIVKPEGKTDSAQ